MIKFSIFNFSARGGLHFVSQFSNGVTIGLVENVLLWVFLLLVPTQLGRHWWPEWSYVLGIRVDYLSPTLYLLDIIWLGIFILNFSAKGGFRFAQQFFLFKEINFKTILIWLFVLMNILVARDRAVAVYKWLRVGQWVWMVMYLKGKRIKVRRYLISVIPYWIATESILGVAQVVKGGSMGGIFYWLGERSFRLTTTGIAQMMILGNGIVRAYGTFSHPNSLAGFLLVSLVYWSIFARAMTDKKNKVKYWVVMWLGMMGIVLSGSRIVWLLGIMILIFNFSAKGGLHCVSQFFRQRRTSPAVAGFAIFKKDKKRLLGMGLVFMGVILLVLAVVSENYRITDFIGGWDKASMVKRAYLNMAALRMIKENLWLGVGMGNFLVRLPDYQRVNQFFWLQPVHNMFLLVMAEIGILGGIGVIWVIREIRTIKIKNYWWITIVILITGMVDHYWISLPQNWWLMGIILGIGIK